MSRTDPIPNASWYSYYSTVLNCIVSFFQLWRLCAHHVSLNIASTKTKDWCSRVQPLTATCPLPRAVWQMLIDLGIAPVPVSAQHAASVFNDVLRNGLVGAESPFVRKQREETRAAHMVDEGGDVFMEAENGRRVPCPSREPWGDRLCWSIFLEAMVSALYTTGSVVPDYDDVAHWSSIFPSNESSCAMCVVRRCGRHLQRNLSIFRYCARDLT